MRYIRQVIFEKIGKEKQKLLENSNIAIVGIGAIGSNTAELAARAGINLTLIDRDVIDLTNLQRQKLFSEQDINLPKSVVAASHLASINSAIKIKSYSTDLDSDNIKEVIGDADLILDCTDNFEARFLLNDYALKNNIPLIYSAVIGSYGMVFNIMPKKTPCFRCIFKEPTALLGTCDTEGILNTIPNVISAMQVTEAIKVLTKHQYSKELIQFDIWNEKLEKIKVNKNPNCPACNGNYEYLNGKSKQIIKFCGTDSYQIKGDFDIESLKEKLSKLSNIKAYNSFIIFNNLTIFRDRVLIKAKNQEEAKIIFDKYLI